MRDEDNVISMPLVARLDTTHDIIDLFERHTRLLKSLQEDIPIDATEYVFPNMLLKLMSPAVQLYMICHPDAEAHHCYEFFGHMCAHAFNLVIEQGAEARRL